MQGTLFTVQRSQFNHRGAIGVYAQSFITGNPSLLCFRSGSGCLENCVEVGVVLVQWINTDVSLLQEHIR